MKIWDLFVHTYTNFGTKKNARRLLGMMLVRCKLISVELQHTHFTQVFAFYEQTRDLFFSLNFSDYIYITILQISYIEV